MMTEPGWKISPKDIKFWMPEDYYKKAETVRRLYPKSNIYIQFNRTATYPFPSELDQAQKTSVELDSDETREVQYNDQLWAKAHHTWIPLQAFKYVADELWK